MCCSSFVLAVDGSPASPLLFQGRALEQASVREIKWDAYRKYSEDQLEAEQHRAVELELQVSALKEQLQEAEIHYKQKEEQVSLREVQWEADQNHSLDELKAQRQYAIDLEKQIEALAQKLQSVDAQYKQKILFLLWSCPTMTSAISRFAAHIDSHVT
ncbi:unnamed protein product [Urochloa humidicola]